MAPVHINYCSYNIFHYYTLQIDRANRNLKALSCRQGFLKIMVDMPISINCSILFIGKIKINPIGLKTGFYRQAILRSLFIILSSSHQVCLCDVT